MRKYDRLRRPSKLDHCGAMIVRSLRSCAAIIVVLGSFAAPARAAEIGCDSFYGETRPPEEEAQRLWPSGARPTPGTCRAGFIQGEIVKGDYEKFLALYRKNHPFLGLVMLHSPGGDADEALKIGRLLRKYLINAYSPSRLTAERSVLPSYRSEKVSWLCDGPGCICASACALIWFGAPDRTGEVGLHRPRFEGPAFKALSPAEAARTYRRMLDGIVGYLEEMETPKPLIEAMVSTSSAEIQWFDFVRNDRRPPSFAEWTDASCGQFTNQEYDKEIELLANREKLSQTEKLLMNLLFEKDQRKLACERELISSHREKLPAPFDTTGLTPVR